MILLMAGCPCEKFPPPMPPWIQIAILFFKL